MALVRRRWLPDTGQGIGCGKKHPSWCRVCHHGAAIDAVIDHSVPRTKIVPVLPLTVLIPPNITTPPVRSLPSGDKTLGKAVTVMVEPWEYLPNASGAGLKTSWPFEISKTVWPGSSGLPFTDSCIPWSLGAWTIVGVAAGVSVGNGVYVGTGVRVSVGDGVDVGDGVGVTIITLAVGIGCGV